MSLVEQCQQKTRSLLQVAPLDVSLDFAALEAEFAAREAPRGGTGALNPDGGARAGAARAPGRPSLLPLQRANNVGIVLARLKLSPAEARPAA